MNVQWLKKLSQCFNNVVYMLNAVGITLCNISEIFYQILAHSSYNLSHILHNSIEI